MASLFRRKQRDGSKGRIWWCKYRDGGIAKRVSTGTGDARKAKKFVAALEGRLAASLPVMPRADKVSYPEIAEDLRKHYAASGDRDLAEAGYRLKHLDRFFARFRVAAIGGAQITAYVVERQQAGAAAGTVNRELATLSRMLRLGYENGKILRLPVIHRLKESAAREGFFEEDQYQAVRRRLPEDLQAAIAIMHTYGWRKAEVLGLERRQLDLRVGPGGRDATLRLDMSKNGEPRIVYLTPELKVLLTAQVERVDRLSRHLGRIVTALFPHTGGRRAGTPRRGFGKRWRRACEQAGVPGRLLHDFRRTAVRNMERQGVPRSVAMKLTGHRTEAVYRRYAIVNDAQLREAALRLAEPATGQA
jgi:integrase